MAHNNDLTFLLLEDNDSICPKSAAELLSLALAEGFLLLNFSEHSASWAKQAY